MTTILKPSDPYPAASLAVDRVLALGSQRVVDVHPLAEELAASFPRHGRSELCAAVITAIALRGAALRWRPEQAVRRGA
jgi:hypothetical protein